MKNQREEYLKTITRKQSQPVPYYFNLCQAMIDKFVAKHGEQDYKDYYEIPIREVFLKPTKLDPMKRFTPYFKHRKIEGSITEWGIELKKSSLEHFSSMIGPLHDQEDVEAVNHLPLPDFLEDYRWEGVKEQICQLKEKGYITMVGIYGGNDIGSGEDTVPAFMDIFESSWYLCGLDHMLMSFYSNEEFVQALLDKVTDFKVALARKWAEAGVDILTTADDVGTQKGMMMAPDMYRKWIKPRLQRVISAAKSVNPDVLVFYHSDGNIEDIIPDLIEVGVEILNPIQPECMDPDAIISKYINQVSFWGTIGTQTVLPFGTVHEICDVCSERLRLVKETGGLILAPTHLVEPEVPLENIEMMVEVIQKNNREA